MNHEQRFRELSEGLAASSKRGLPMIIAGVLFWLAAGLSGFLDRAIAVWVYLYGIGLIFPLGILLARLMNIDLFAKGNPLGGLAGAVGGMQILFAPVVLLVLFQLPDYMPFTVGVLTGAHFLPFAVIYGSRAYAFLSAATVAGAALTGFFAHAHTFLATPFTLTAVYAAACLWLVKENRRRGSSGAGESS